MLISNRVLNCVFTIKLSDSNRNQCRFSSIQVNFCFLIKFLKFHDYLYLENKVIEIPFSMRNKSKWHALMNQHLNGLDYNTYSSRWRWIGQITGEMRHGSSIWFSFRDNISGFTISIEYLAQTGEMAVVRHDALYHHTGRPNQTLANN